jgi:hypothetical protein
MVNRLNLRNTCPLSFRSRPSSFRLHIDDRFLAAVLTTPRRRGIVRRIPLKIDYNLEIDPGGSGDCAMG